MATPEQLAALKRMDAARRRAERQQGLDAARRRAERQQGLDAAREWRRQMLRGAAPKREPRA